MKRKIKALGIILSTYFQVHTFAVIANVVSLILWLIATVMTFTQPYRFASDEISPQWMMFTFALVNMMMVSVFNLRRLIASNTGTLFPHYRSMHLLGFGLLLIAYLLWPVFIMGIQGQPVLPTLALYIFTVTILLWGIFTFGERGSVMIPALWAWKLMFDMLGFPSKFVISSALVKVAPFGSHLFFQIVVITVSLGLFVLWCRYFLTVPGYKLPTRKMDYQGPYLNSYDRVNPWLNRLIDKSLEKILSKKKSEISIFRLIQYALFSPGIAFTAYSLVIMVSIIFFASSGLYLYINVVRDGVVDIERVVPITSFLYVLSAGFIAFDFLQHRHRLPALWLAAPLASRKSFTRTVFLVYLKVATGKYLLTSFLFLLLPVVFPELTLMRVLPVIALGGAIYLFYIALSILMGHEIVSSDCKGWLIGAIMGLGYAWIFLLLISNARFSNTPPTWYFIATTVAVGLMMMWRAYVRWQQTEFNFNGPELYARDY